MSRRNRGKITVEAPVASHVYMVGGRGEEGQALSSVEFLNTKQILPEWKPITPLPDKRWGACAACWGEKLYVFGGQTSGDMLNTAAVYDPADCQWGQIPDMLHCRAQASATAVGKRIYVCGGWGGSGRNSAPLETVERFDPAENMWEALPSMSAKRFNLAAACVGPFLFVFGGNTDKPEPLKSAERFDARETKDWQSLPNMLERRQGAAAAVLYGLPHVCGGHDGQWCLSSVERFQLDPKGSAGGSWKAMPNMNTVRYAGMACTCVHNDRRTKIFVFGGHNGIERTCDVECFGTDDQEWELVPKNPNAHVQRMEIRAGAAVACMVEPKEKFDADDEENLPAQFSC